LEYRSAIHGVVGKMYVRPSHMRRSVSLDGRGSPLSSRGWVLQERLLSPRTLHYGKEQMFWECCTCKISEDDENPDEYDEILRYIGPGRDWENNKQFLLPPNAVFELSRTSYAFKPLSISRRCY
jgi:hypothetical protein